MMTSAPARVQKRRLPLIQIWSALVVSTCAVLWGANLRADGASTTVTSHGYSFYGDLTYPADYPHFNYVNPEAPKGGEISISTLGTFDSMNPYSRKGRGGVLSSMMYESLLGDGTGGESAPADVYSEHYCLLCESLEYPETKDWVIFKMRTEARFSTVIQLRRTILNFLIICC